MTRCRRNSTGTRAQKTVREGFQLRCATQSRARNSLDPRACCLAACDRIRLISQPVHFLEARASLLSKAEADITARHSTLFLQQSSQSSTFSFHVYQATHLPEPAIFFHTLDLVLGARLHYPQSFGSQHRERSRIHHTACRPLQPHKHQQTLLQE